MNILVVIIFLLGFFFTFAGIIGVLRLPDFYSRLHAVGKSDTLGVMLMLGSIALHQGLSLNALKIMVIVLFIFIVNPLVTHALGHAAWKKGTACWTKGDDRK